METRERERESMLESEEEPSYQFLVNDEIVALPETLLPYFITLYNMVSDSGIQSSSHTTLLLAPIPIHYEGITAQHLKAMIDFYRAYQQAKPTDFSSLNTLHPVSTSLWSYWYDVAQDMQRVTFYARLADYLDAHALLVFVVDLLASAYYRMATDDLVKEAAALVKRKREGEEGETEEHPLPLRRQYKHALAIQRIMEYYLPCTLAPGVDPRIQRMVEPIVSSNRLAMIRTREGLYLAGSNKGINKLPSTETMDIELSRTAFPYVDEHGAEMTLRGNASSILLDDGQLLLYGRYYYTSYFEPPSTYQTSPLPQSSYGECLAVWQGDDHFVALTPQGLFSWGNRGWHLGHDGSGKEPKKIASSSFEDKDVLDVSAGRYHTLILTRKNVLVCGGVLTPFPKFQGPKLTLRVVNVADVIAIASGSRHAMLLTRLGDVWTHGDNSSGQLGMPLDVVAADDDKWVRPTLPDAIQAIKRIYCGTNQSFIVTIDDRLYACGNNQYNAIIPDNARIKIESFQLVALEYNTIGEILSVAGTDEWTLIGTTRGIYIIMNPDLLAVKIQLHMVNQWFHVKEEGKKYYTLPIQFDYHVPSMAIEKEDADATTCVPAHKKKRYSCYHCTAEARYATTDSLFCSKYCFLKSRMTHCEE